jgi:hypothetical protein
LTSALGNHRHPNNDKEEWNSCFERKLRPFFGEVHPLNLNWNVQKSEQGDG